MGLNNFILTCEKDNEELRKDINYYNNMTSRLKKENQELKEKIEKIREIVENSDWRLDDVHDLIDGYNEIAKIII